MMYSSYVRTVPAEVKTTVEAAFVETGVVVILLDPLVFVTDALSEDESVCEAEEESDAEAEAIINEIMINNEVFV